MTKRITAAAASVRESFRTSTGQFGTQAKSEADLMLAGSDQPRGARVATVPRRGDDEALTRFVGDKAMRSAGTGLSTTGHLLSIRPASTRPRLHGGDPTVHYGGHAIITDLQREPAGAQMSWP